MNLRRMLWSTHSGRGFGRFTIGSLGSWKHLFGNAATEMYNISTFLKAIELYGQIPIRSVDVELDESLRLADALGIYACDAYLIRCAQKYRSPILSLDGYLLECASRTEMVVLEKNQ